MKKLGKLLAGCIVAGLLLMPMSCTKGEFVNTTDRIGNAMAVVNMSYAVLEVMLEEAIQKKLPDAAVIQGYIDYLKKLRDVIAEGYDVAQAEAAADVAATLVQQGAEVVK